MAWVYYWNSKEIHGIIGTLLELPGTLLSLIGNFTDIEYCAQFEGGVRQFGIGSVLLMCRGWTCFEMDIIWRNGKLMEALTALHD